MLVTMLIGLHALHWGENRYLEDFSAISLPLDTFESICLDRARTTDG